jgi:hypothetical protein
LASPPPPQTWKQAHLQYCRQHLVFVASPQQVLQSLPDGEELSWTLPKVELAVVVVASTGSKQDMLQAILQPKQEPASTTGGTSSSSSSSSYIIWSQVYGAVSNRFWNSEHNDDDDFSEHVEWNQAGDHAAEALEGASSQSQPRAIVDWKDPLLCLELIIPCWHNLQTRLAREVVDPPHLLKRTEWKEWLGQDIDHDNDDTGDGDDNDSMLSSIHQKDADLLLDLLMMNQQAKLVSRNGKPELIALQAAAFSDDENNNSNNALDAAVTIWDLNVAMQSTERQLETWAVQVGECEQKAMHYKLKKQSQQALFQMGRRQLLQRQMESSAQILHKLEQTKLAVWQAQSNTSLVGTLTLATKTLQELRTSRSTPTLDQVEDLQDNLQEELDGLSELQLMGQEHQQQPHHDNEEDEALLQELADLTVEDNDSKTKESSLDKEEELAHSLEELALSLPVAPTTGMVVRDELGTKVATEESI